MLKPIEWKDNKLILIDQNKLPNELTSVICEDYFCVAEAIKSMKVRGAPAIGATAAFGIALAVLKSKAKTITDAINDLKTAADVLRKTRPTAVNLFWAIDRMMNKLINCKSLEELRETAVSEALAIYNEDIAMNKQMGKYGSKLIDDGDVILTHCNAGTLATAGYGTALGVIRAAWEEGKKISVFADETRPKLQGARLTAFELHYDKIPVTVITDNMAAYFMSKGIIKKVIVGADRILKTGHVINKIGTYGVAILAKHHNIPFYVAAPSSTFDLKSSVDEVVIEERSHDEVIFVGGHRIVPEGVPVKNPAFDITPPELVTAIITEKGVIYPPYDKNIPSTISPA
ncbi:MAG: S-methyl-5-thioribose-1-phosphate isomerase [Candidatus Odinarchaeota archaeon]|nr:S-methyl-5-thioribose-1-phosphate isomerase [Candidatus Odinarchaeota archaeon]